MNDQLKISLKYNSLVAVKLLKFCSNIIKSSFLIDFVLVIRGFLTFYWCKILNGYINFLLNFMYFRMAVVSVETLEN